RRAAAARPPAPRPGGPARPRAARRAGPLAPGRPRRAGRPHGGGRVPPARPPRARRAITPGGARERDPLLGRVAARRPGAGRGRAAPPSRRARRGARPRRARPPARARAGRRGAGGRRRGRPRRRPRRPRDARRPPGAAPPRRAAPHPAPGGRPDPRGPRAGPRLPCAAGPQRVRQEHAAAPPGPRARDAPAAAARARHAHPRARRGRDRRRGGPWPRAPRAAGAPPADALGGRGAARRAGEGAWLPRALLSSGRARGAPRRGGAPRAGAGHRAARLRGRLRARRDARRRALRPRAVGGAPLRRADAVAVLLAVAAATLLALAAPWPAAAAVALAALLVVRERKAFLLLAGSTIAINAAVLWLAGGGLEQGAVGGLRMAAAMGASLAALSRVGAARLAEGLRLPPRATAWVAAVLLAAHDVRTDFERLRLARTLEGAWPRGRLARAREAARLLPALTVAAHRRAAIRRDALRLAGHDTPARFVPIVTVAALATAGRLALLALPNVKLTYVVVFLGGLLWGPLVGATGGALAMLMTDLMLSGLYPPGLVNVPAMALLGLAGGALRRVDWSGLAGALL